jgi:hypothetical protein
MMNALNSTGQISSRHAGNPSGNSTNSSNFAVRRQAWQNQQFMNENDLLADREQLLTFPTGKPPLPPVPSQPGGASDTPTQRTHVSKKDEDLLEEWYTVSCTSLVKNKKLLLIYPLHKI